MEFLWVRERETGGIPALASLSHSQKLHKIPSHSHLAQFVSAPAPSQQPHALLARVALPKRSPERFTLKGKGKAIQSEQNIWRIIMERYGWMFCQKIYNLGATVWDLEAVPNGWLYLKVTISLPALVPYYGTSPCPLQFQITNYVDVWKWKLACISYYAFKAGKLT